MYIFFVVIFNSFVPLLIPHSGTELRTSARVRTVNWWQSVVGMVSWMYRKNALNTGCGSNSSSAGHRFVKLQSTRVRPPSICQVQVFGRSSTWPKAQKSSHVFLCRLHQNSCGTEDPRCRTYLCASSNLFIGAPNAQAVVGATDAPQAGDIFLGCRMAKLLPTWKIIPLSTFLPCI